jgi:hypothetical protein
MIALSLESQLRRIAVAAVLVAYAIPLSLGTLSQLGHGAAHLIEQMEERQARAAALGLVHLSAERSQSSSEFVHTHDGVTHSHAGPVDALLSASKHTDEEQHVAVPMVKLSAHAPATVVFTWIALAIVRAPAATDAVAPDHPRPLPPLPPPRG